MPASWDDLKLASELREAIDTVGWLNPTQVQTASIPPMLKGQDVALQSRTGSGKTGAFVLPLLQRATAWQHTVMMAGSHEAGGAKKRKALMSSLQKDSATSSDQQNSNTVTPPPIFLCLVPSVELCAQTVSVFEKLGKFLRPRVQLVNLPARQQQQTSNNNNGNNNSGNNNKNGPTTVEAPVTSALVIVSTPAFLVKAIKSSILSIDLVSQVSVLVVDEADMLTSHASMQFLYGLLPPTRQSVVLSATLTESVARLKGALLNQPVAVRVDEEENLLKSDALLAKMNKKNNKSEDGAAADSNDDEDDKNNNNNSQEVRVVLPPEDRSKLKQNYLVATDDCNRHTLLYSLFRFQGLLLNGKTLIFVDDEKEPYRLQHFLEQLAIHSLVYDMTLPIKARCDILSRFQDAEKGVLICTDHTLHMAERLQAELGKQEEKEVVSSSSDDDEDDDGKTATTATTTLEVKEDTTAANDEDAEKVDEDAAKKQSTKATKQQQQQKKKSNNKKGGANNNSNVEPGLSRGIDFQNVTNVILFQGVKAVSDEAFTNYLHRVGRTARAGKEGLAISLFSVPEAKQMLGPLRDFLRESRGEQLRPFKKLERTNASALQYRVQAAVQNVTRHAAKKLRVANVAAEMGRSAYLSTRLNEADTGVLKRLMSGATKQVTGDKNLRDVPEYMHISKADDRDHFEGRVAARKLSGGRSRFHTFRNLTTSGMEAAARAKSQRKEQQKKQQEKRSASNKSNNNNNNSKKMPDGKRGRAGSSNNKNNNNRSKSGSTKPSSSMDPLAAVAAKMASKRRKIEASD